MGRISALTELTELAGNDYFLVLDSSANIGKKITVANALGIPEYGWTASGETWTYASATTVTVPTDATTKYQAGMFVKVTQSTGGTKYGMIRTVASTLLTIVWLNGATLANETISTPFYSIGRSPLGVGTNVTVDYQTDNSNTVADSKNSPIKLEAGWGQINGPATPTSTVTGLVTFPTQFTTVLGVVVSPLGGYTGTARSDITGLDSEYANDLGLSSQATDISTSGFRVTLGRTSGSFSSAAWYGFSWIAWGIV